MTILRRATASAVRHRRGRVVHAVPGEAPRAGGRRAQHHRFPRSLRCSSVSGQGEGPPYPNTTKLSRRHVQHAVLEQFGVGEEQRCT